MKVFFTADCHFDHANIIAYTGRPFSKEGDYFLDEVGHVIWKSDKIARTDANWMNDTIIKRWNEVVTQDDLVYHIGDFAFKGVLNSKRFEQRLNGDIVHILGNHDMNNGTKSYISKCMMEFGGRDIFVQHRPPDIVPICDFCICGHVHEKWKYKWVDMGIKSMITEHQYIPVINVGVDVWEFEPVSTLSLLKIYNKIIKEGNPDESNSR